MLVRLTFSSADITIIARMEERTSTHIKVRYFHESLVLTGGKVYMKEAEAYKACISTPNLADTGFSYTLSLINGKYKMTILYTLMCFGVVRFNEMKKYIGEISYKTLSSTLKELEADELIQRIQYNEMPLRVEYSLTEKGRDLLPVFYAISQWGMKYIP